MKISKSYVISTEEQTIGAGTSNGYLCVIPSIFPNRDYLIESVTWSYKCRSLLGIVMPREINESLAAELQIFNSDGILPAVNELPLGSTPEPRVNFPPAPDNVLRLFETGNFVFGRLRFRNYISLYLFAENFSPVDVWFQGSIIIDISSDE